MRFTVIDSRGRVSFIAPCNALEGLVAACAAQPRSVEHLLRAAQPFVGALSDRVMSGLAVFDEHNSASNFRWVHAALDYCIPSETPVLRVVDPRTEEVSLSPVRAGVVVFNLTAKRIVQIQNTYAEIRRKGHVHVLQDNRPTGKVHRYELPAEWSLVPAG